LDASHSKRTYRFLREISPENELKEKQIGSPLLSTAFQLLHLLKTKTGNIFKKKWQGAPGYVPLIWWQPLVPLELQHDHWWHLRRLASPFLNLMKHHDINFWSPGTSLTLERPTICTLEENAGAHMAIPTISKKFSAAKLLQVFPDHFKCFS